MRSEIPQMVLRNSELSTLGVLTGAVGRAFDTAVAEQVYFKAIREKVRMELGMFLDHA